MATFVTWPLFSYKKSLGMHRTEGWLDPRAGMVAAQKRIFCTSLTDLQITWSSSDLVTMLIELSQSTAHY